MDELKVTKTRKSYHDIGICVVVVEDKVTDLLRKIVANELSKKDGAKCFDPFSIIRKRHDNDYVSFKILKQLATETNNKTLLQWLVTENDCDIAFLEAFQVMNGRLKEKFKGDVSSVNIKLLKYLNGKRKNLIKVLIEQFTCDIKAKATDLNNILRKNKTSWMPLGKMCFHNETGAQLPKRHKGCDDYCKYRYKMNDDSKGGWDWVDGMNYIRNGVIHRSFKFEDQDQEGEFRRNYTNFIDEVPFEDLFSSKEVMEKKEECMEIMTVHDDVKGEIGKLKGEVGRLKSEVGRWKGEVGRWKGDVGRWKHEVERLSEENRAWVSEYYELQHQLNEEIRYLMEEITELDKWQRQAKVKKRAAKKRASWL